MPVRRTPSSNQAKRPSAPRRTTRARKSPSASTASRPNSPLATRHSPLGFKPTPRFLSTDEKRQMILAHAAMRQKTHDPLQIMSVWAGVAVAFAVVVGGWAWAMLPSYVSAFKDPLGVGQVASGLSDVNAKATAQASALLQGNAQAAQLQATANQLQAEGEQLQAERTAIGIVANKLNASSTSGTPSIFSPTTSTSTP